MSVFRMVTTVSLVMLLLLSACTSSENKAQARLDEVGRLEQRGELVLAEAQYQQLIADFPGTGAAGRAAEQLQHLREQKRQQQAAVREILRRFEDVLNGYQVMFQHLPSSSRELDESEYFFDSAYLAEMIPEGLEVFLGLYSTGTGYRLWVVSAKLGAGVYFDRATDSLQEVQLEQVRSSIEGLPQDERLTRLTFLTLG